MRTKEVEVGKHKFVIKEISPADDVEIRNRAYEIELPTSRDSRARPKMLFGEFQAMTVWAGLKEWDLKNEAGQPVPITIEAVKELLPQKAKDELFNLIDELNRVSTEESDF